MGFQSIRACVEIRSVRPVTVPFLLALLLVIGACTEKARVIQVGAAQFETEALAAIGQIDNLRVIETQVPPSTPAEDTELFVGLVLGSTEPITRSTLKVIVNPLEISPGNSDAEWQAFLQRLRTQYTTFSRTFASLDKGSLFAAPAVEKTIPHLDNLVAQMAAFAESIRKNPAEFTRARAGIADALEAARDDGSLTRVQQEGRIRDLERQLRDVMAAEQEATRAALEQCLRAVQIGGSLRTLLADYGTLSVADIADGLTVGFALASEVSGEDLTSLQGRTDAVIDQIKEDSDLTTLFNQASARIGAART